MQITVERKRGCGYRKIGGLYLCGEGPALACDVLPYVLHECPTCGGGIKFSRGFQWLDAHYFKEAVQALCNMACKGLAVCPFKENKGRYGLMWIGKSFYTPASFILEAETLGISKRITALPKGLKLGETWIMLAHKEAGINNGVKVPAIFYCFRPQRVEKILTENMATEEELENLKKRNITPVVVEDHPRHHGSAHEKDGQVEAEIE